MKLNLTEWRSLSGLQRENPDLEEAADPERGDVRMFWGKPYTWDGKKWVGKGKSAGSEKGSGSGTARGSDSGKSGGSSAGAAAAGAAAGAAVTAAAGGAALKAAFDSMNSKLKGAEAAAAATAAGANEALKSFSDRDSELSKALTASQKKVFDNEVSAYNAKREAIIAKHVADLKEKDRAKAAETVEVFIGRQRNDATVNLRTAAYKRGEDPDVTVTAEDIRKEQERLAVERYPDHYAGGDNTVGTLLHRVGMTRDGTFQYAQRYDDETIQHAMETGPYSKQHSLLLDDPKVPIWYYELEQAHREIPPPVPSSLKPPEAVEALEATKIEPEAVPKPDFGDFLSLSLRAAAPYAGVGALGAAALFASYKIGKMMWKKRKAKKAVSEAKQPKQKKPPKYDAAQAKFFKAVGEKAGKRVMVALIKEFGWDRVRAAGKNPKGKDAKEIAAFTADYVRKVAARSVSKGRGRT